VHKLLLSPEALYITYLGSEFYVFYYVQDRTVFIVDLERR